MEIKSYRLKNYDRFFVNRIAVLILIIIICLNYVFQDTRLDSCFKHKILENIIPPIFLILDNIFIILPILLILGLISLFFKKKYLLKKFKIIIIISFIIQGQIIISFIFKHFFIDSLEYDRDFIKIALSYLLVFFHSYILDVINNVIKSLKNDLQKNRDNL